MVKQITFSQASAGSVRAHISLKKVKRGKLTLRVTVTDANGASTAVERAFKAR